MPCGKRLVAMLADWLGPYERVHGTLESESRKRLLKMSAATADRLLQAHKVQGGASMSESFVWALSATDVFSGWPEVRAIWNRGQEVTLKALEEMELSFPFRLRGIDTDNGSEFLNWHVVTHFANRPIRVEQTRSRPYQKNDQARIEQKNWTHVRQLMGYDRFGHRELVDPINGLLRYLDLPRFDGREPDRLLLV